MAFIMMMLLLLVAAGSGEGCVLSGNPRE